jgi:hypothetical protein
MIEKLESWSLWIINELKDLVLLMNDLWNTQEIWEMLNLFKQQLFLIKDKNDLYFLFTWINFVIKDEEIKKSLTDIIKLLYIKRFLNESDEVENEKDKYFQKLMWILPSKI